MTDQEEFTKREKQMIYNVVKPRRFDSDEYYELYEKVSKWQ